MSEVVSITLMEPPPHAPPSTHGHIPLLFNLSPGELSFRVTLLKAVIKSQIVEELEELLSNSSSCHVSVWGFDSSHHIT